ncbi:hypothetical protein CYMTET_16731 [Cymbomonas tetramitiformis]|uniref:LOV domain-containing protein n=1 Tax=Cymbomonas tetramitiformis TaxID=36881 RepID=A0AAE0GBG2_9CHLO|nr:hypothetical protein CYMTET_16731 [Cymbomonas tetramitiformis]
MKSGKKSYSPFCASDQDDSVEWVGGFQNPADLPACDGLPPHICGSDYKVMQRISDMLAAMPSGLIVCDALEHDCPLLYANPLFEHVSGYTTREILGRNCRFLQYRGPFAEGRHEAVDRAECLAMQRAVTTGSEYRGVVVNFTKNGTPFLNSIYLTPLYSDTAEPSLVTHFAAVLRMRIHEELVLTPIAVRPAFAGTSRAHNLTSGPSEALPDPKSWKLKGDLLRNAWLVELGERELGHILGFLDMQSILRAGSTCKFFATVVRNDSLWRSVFLRVCGPDTTVAVEPVARRLGWLRVVRELHTLSAASWRSIKVGGSVYPDRTKFATCSVGNKILVFGGESRSPSGSSKALNDMFLLDLDGPAPAWVPVLQSSSAPQPAARWGHTLRKLGGGVVILFGGCDELGRALNDTFVFDLSEPSPQWREVKPLVPWMTGGGMPPPRSWHAASTNANELVVFGGCDYKGRLLDDTWQLDLSRHPPAWHEVLGDWNPQPRLGASLCCIGEREHVLFGGLASVGSVRLRSNDLFTLTGLSGPKPSWKYVSGSTLPSGSTQAGTPPAPRLEQTMGGIGGGRVLVFGGSNSEVANNLETDPGAASQPFVCDVSSGKPKWHRLETAGTGPEFAWGYSTAHLDDLRFVTPGKYQGGFLGFNELFELSLFSPSGLERDSSPRVSDLEQRLQENTAQPLPGPFSSPSWSMGDLGSGSGGSGSGGSGSGGSGGGADYYQNEQQGYTSGSGEDRASNGESRAGSEGREDSSGNQDTERLGAGSQEISDRACAGSQEILALQRQIFNRSYPSQSIALQAEMLLADRSPD